MNNWTDSIRRALVSGAISSVASTVALSALGKRDSGDSVAPVNAVSHWFYGDDAIGRDGASARYTVPGYLIHHASATFWAVLYERFFGHALDRRNAATTAGGAAVTSALACFTDYQLTPPRLRPGFERHLNRTSLAVVYGTFGLGLALGAMLVRRR